MFHELVIWAMTQYIILITLAKAMTEITEDYMGPQRKRLTRDQTSEDELEEVKSKRSLENELK